MLKESEWEEVKKSLITLYKNKITYSSEEIENTLLNILVRDNNQETVTERVNEVRNRFSLSTRETEVLNELIDGRTNYEISEHLSVSLSTIKKHVYNIFNKIGVNSRSQLLNLVYTIE